MNFYSKHATKIKVTIATSIVLDVASGIIVNIISSEGFDISDGHNVVFVGLLVVLTAVLIVCRIAENGVATRSKTKKLLKTFQENGGYEVLADEMKICIRNHDIKAIRELKRMADIIEK